MEIVSIKDKTLDKRSLTNEFLLKMYRILDADTEQKKILVNECIRTSDLNEHVFTLVFRYRCHVKLLNL